MPPQSFPTSRGIRPSRRRPPVPSSPFCTNKAVGSGGVCRISGGSAGAEHQLVTGHIWCFPPPEGPSWRGTVSPSGSRLQQTRLVHSDASESLILGSPGFWVLFSGGSAPAPFPGAQAPPERGRGNGRDGGAASREKGRAFSLLRSGAGAVPGVAGRFVPFSTRFVSGSSRGWGGDAGETLRARAGSPFPGKPAAPSHRLRELGFDSSRDTRGRRW